MRCRRNDRDKRRFALEQRFTFDQVAGLYDQARAGYPQALYDDLMVVANLAAGDAVLEVGCGTGKATEDFARRGLTRRGARSGTRHDRGGAATGGVLVDASSASWRRHSRRGRSRRAPSGSSQPRRRGTGSPPTSASGRLSMRLPRADRSRCSAAPLEMSPSPCARPLSEPMRATRRSSPDRRLNAPICRTARSRAISSARGSSDPSRTNPTPGAARSRRKPMSIISAPSRATGSSTTSRRESLFADVAKAIEAHGGSFDLPFETHLYVARRVG